MEVGLGRLDVAQEDSSRRQRWAVESTEPWLDQGQQQPVTVHLQSAW